MDRHEIISMTSNDRRRFAVRLMARIQAGLLVPALVAGIAALALVVMTVQCPRLARANSPIGSQVAGSEAELICSPKTGIPTDEPHAGLPREVKAPLAEAP